MLMKVSFVFLIQLWVHTISYVTVGSYIQRRRVFSATRDGFQLDGKNFHVYAGEIHYFRIASCWWQDRLKKLQTVGFNTVSTAIEWAMHEPKPDNYQWHDADRDLGGLPKWLFTTNLSKSGNQIREYNAEYRYRVKKWLHFLLPKLASRTVANGGPIIMFQIDSDLGDNPLCGENEWLYDVFASYLGVRTVMFTMNQNLYQSIFCGHINGTVPAFRTNPLEYSVTFDSSITKLFAPVQETFPNFPKLVELRCGSAWFWGGKRLSYDSRQLEMAISDIIGHNSSMILYMFAGGTNFERAGSSASNANGMITSYDYDAPVSEPGDLAERYFRLKSILGKRAKFANYGDNLSELRGRSRALYGKLNFTCLGSFLDPAVRKDLGIVPVTRPDPLMFHEINSATVEMVLYETVVPRDFGVNARMVEIHSLGIHDRGYVYIGRVLIGIMNHTRHTITTSNPVIPGQRIQILVENQGYRMYSIFADRKGISSDVYLNDVALKNWTMHALSFDDIERWQRVAERMKARGRYNYRGNCLCRASFVVSSNFTAPMDSILDVTMLGKGRVFLNEYSLGKYWPKMGPQQYLYVPGCFIKPYPLVNQMLILELHHRPLIRKSSPRRVRSRKKLRNAANSIFEIRLIFVCVILSFVR